MFTLNVGFKWLKSDKAKWETSTANKWNKGKADSETNSLKRWHPIPAENKSIET